MRDQNILKAVLLLRKCGNKSNTKEKQIHEVYSWFEKGYITDAILSEWVGDLKQELSKTPDQLAIEEEEYIKRICAIDAEQAMQELGVESRYTSCTTRDYGPSNPWDAPGMRIGDFI